uniref:Cyclin-dependent kinase inhibitor n=1 Tax=Macrostomum lignano TaxID=282301 RepID=A0A1I8F2D3_9PLAT
MSSLQAESQLRRERAALQSTSCSPFAPPSRRLPAVLGAPTPSPLRSPWPRQSGSTAGCTALWCAPRCSARKSSMAASAVAHFAANAEFREALLASRLCGLARRCCGCRPAAIDTQVGGTAVAAPDGVKKRVETVMLQESSAKFSASIRSKLPSTTSLLPLRLPPAATKSAWVVHKKRSKCAGVMAATLIGMADSESEEDDIEEKLEKYETQKQRYEFRVKHNFEDEGYRPGPR